jgi:hypothetical protein
MKKKGFRNRASGLGKEVSRKKWNGNSPSPLIPFDRLTTPLSLGGARKIKERGYHRPQVPSNQALSVISFFSLFVCFVIAGTK